MYNNYLGKLDGEQHVCIMQGCLGIYVTLDKTPDDYRFSRESKYPLYDIKLVEGKVDDIRNDNYKALKLNKKLVDIKK